MEFLSKLTNTSISSLPESVLFFGGLFGFLFVVSAIIFIFYQLIAQSNREKNIDTTKIFYARERVKALLIKLFLQSMDKQSPSFKERLKLLNSYLTPDDWIEIIKSSNMTIELPVKVESQQYRGFVPNDIRLYYSLKVFLSGFDAVLSLEDINDFSRSNKDTEELNESTGIASDDDLITSKYLWLNSILSRILAFTNKTPTLKQVLIYSQSFLLAQYLDFVKIRPINPPTIEIGLVGLNQALKDAEVSGVDVFEDNPVLPEEWEIFMQSVINEANKFNFDSLNLSIEIARLSLSDTVISESKDSRVIFYTAKNKEVLTEFFNSLNINYQLAEINGEFVFNTSLSDESTKEVMQSIDLMNLADVSMSVSAKEGDEWFEVAKKQLVSDILRINEESIKTIKERQESLKQKAKNKPSEEMLIPVDFWIAFKSDTKAQLNNRTKFNATLEYFGDYLSFTKKDKKREDGSYLSIHIYKFTFPNREVELSFVNHLFESIKKIENLACEETLENIPETSFLRECFYHVRESAEEYIELDMQSMINPFSERINSTGIYEDIFSYLVHINSSQINILPKIYSANSTSVGDIKNILILRSPHNNFVSPPEYFKAKDLRDTDGIQLQDIPMFYEIASLYNANILIAFDKTYIYILFETAGKSFSLAVIEAKISQIYSPDAWEALENIEISRCRLGSKDLNVFEKNPAAINSRLIYKPFNNSRRLVK